MKIYFENSVATNMELSDEGFACYLALRIIANDQSEIQNQIVTAEDIFLWLYCQNQNIASLSDKIKEFTNSRFKRDIIKKGIKELTNLGYIKLLGKVAPKVKAYELTNILLNRDKIVSTGSNRVFRYITLDELNVILSYDSGKLGLAIMRYFCILLTTFDKCKKTNFSTELKQKVLISYADMDMLSQLTQLSHTTVHKYNNELEFLKILYVRRSCYIYKSSNFKTLRNIYARYEHKDYADEAGKLMEQSNGTKDMIKSNYFARNEKKSLKQKYHQLQKGKEYPYEVILRIYQYILYYNKYRAEDRPYCDLSVFSQWQDKLDNDIKELEQHES